MEYILRYIQFLLCYNFIISIIFFIFSIGDTVRMNCKVIYKEFSLPVKACMKEGSQSITEMDSGNEPITTEIARPLQNDSTVDSLNAWENTNDIEASGHRSSR